MQVKTSNLCKKTIDCIQCSSYEFCLSWLKFVTAHQEPKKYIHFDEKVSLYLDSIRKYVLNPDSIATHSFYPFIHFTKKQNKFGKEKKYREIRYCCHLDRCVYQRYSFLLNFIYNKHVENIGINDVAIAYRDNLNKNNIDFAKEAFDSIKQMSPCTVIVGDFTDFFDNLDHDYLKNALCKLLNVDKLPNDYYAIYKNITRYASWDWSDLV